MEVKLETEIKNLKKELSLLRQVALAAGVPLLIVYMPSLIIGKAPKPSKQDIKWAKEKIKEYKNITNDKTNKQ